MPKRRFVKFFIILAISASLLISSWSRKWLRTMPYNKKFIHEIKLRQPNISVSETREEYKRILFWYEPYPGRSNPSRGYYSEFTLDEDTQLLKGCEPQLNCEITSYGRTDDSNRLKKYDAIIFHQRSWNPLDIPEHRWPHQQYVFLSMESPAWRFTDTESMAGFFNWTMTYRRDSDIYNPYGWFSPKQTQGNGSGAESSSQIQKIKKKMTAWFVSNCKSLSSRNEFVKELKKYIDVDIYGNCGNLRCPRSQSEKCRDMVQQKYKFYLSLENSLCQDYVTEKLFAIMHYNVVPVVFDLHGNLERIAPKHSFINAADFSSIKKLADYLIKLNQSDALYNRYFSWKKHFFLRDSQIDLRQGMCKLCSLLHSPRTTNKFYRNMTDWWESKAHCRSLHFNESSSVWSAHNM